MNHDKSTKGKENFTKRVEWGSHVNLFKWDDIRVHKNDAPEKVDKKVVVDTWAVIV